MAKKKNALSDKAYAIASRSTANHTVPIMKLGAIHKTALAALEAGDSDEAALEKTVAFVKTIAVDA